MIIDAHVHADCRPIEDFRDIKIGGVNAIITCAHDPLEMKQSNVNIEHLNRLVYNEPKRVAKHGVKTYVAVGIHPRAIPSDYNKVIEKLPDYLKKKHVIAVGEIGINAIRDIEKEVFIKQLHFADENNYNVIVHTPRTDKKKVTKTTIELLDENINPKLVQLDHVDYSIVDMVIDKDYTLGITVQPEKMSVSQTVNMLDKYGFDKFVLDSDMSSATSIPMSLPETKHELEIRGYKNSDINKVLCENVLNFHNIKL